VAERDKKAGLWFLGMKKKFYLEVVGEYPAAREGEKEMCARRKISVEASDERAPKGVFTEERYLLQGKWDGPPSVSRSW